MNELCGITEAATCGKGLDQTCLTSPNPLGATGRKQWHGVMPLSSVRNRE